MACQNGLTVCWDRSCSGIPRGLGGHLRDHPGAGGLGARFTNEKRAHTRIHTHNTLTLTRKRPHSHTRRLSHSHVSTHRKHTHSRSSPYSRKRDGERGEEEGQEKGRERKGGGRKRSHQTREITKNPVPWVPPPTGRRLPSSPGERSACVHPHPIKWSAHVTQGHFCLSR